MKGYEAETIKELMQKYDEYRAWWININGTDEGFNAWFSKQVGVLESKEGANEQD